MTLTDIPVTITTDNAADVLDMLLRDEQRLVEHMHASTGPGELAELYRLAATNQYQQGRAWELRPGHRRDNDQAAAHCRHEARVLATAAELEQQRRMAAERGRDLPDPTVLLTTCAAGSTPSSDSGALEALTVLYTVAAGGLEEKAAIR